jgi:hypothetical protein
MQNHSATENHEDSFSSVDMSKGSLTMQRGKIGISFGVLCIIELDDEKPDLGDFAE